MNNQRRDLSGALEGVAVWALLTLSLTLAFRHGPQWSHMPDLDAVLPPRGRSLFDALPWATNTEAMLLAAGMTCGGALLLASRSALPVVATTLGWLTFVLFPHAQIRWHILFIDNPNKIYAPGPTAFAFAGAPILILVAWIHRRAQRDNIQQWQARGVDDVDIRRAHAAMLINLATRMALAGGGGTAAAYGLLLLADEAPDVTPLEWMPAAYAAVAILAAIASLPPRAAKTTPQDAASAGQRAKDATE